jgi:hypothetical protein
MRKRTKKFEIRSTKLETNSNDQKIQRVSSDECQGTRNFPLDTRPSTLVPFGFRYSDFGFFSVVSLRLCSGHASRDKGTA